jgi:TM2 domain-containing membrane protein YozV
MFNSTMQIHPSDPPKNAIIAAVLSLLLFGGVGQMYLGQTKKGVIIIVASILLACVGIGFLIPFIGAVDAYMMAEKLQKGESIGDMQWFWEN